MKRLICLVMALVLALLMVGCGDNNSATDSVKVVCASYAEYDWVKNIMGTEKGVTLIADNGTDMHSYQPTAADIISVTTADLVVYTGGTADAWIESALKNNKNESAPMRLMEVVGDRLLCQPSAVSEHGHEHEHHDDNCAYDEHVWLSLKNAKIICTKIYERLCQIDPENKQSYKQNFDSYISKLTSLKADYDKALSNPKNKTVVFADRFPFVYLFSDYNLDYLAAFPGCSSEVDADFETVITLSKRVDELSLGYIMTIDGSNKKLATTVIANTKSKNQKILSLYSLQSVTKSMTYFDAMVHNLEVLKEALSIKEGT